MSLNLTNFKTRLIKSMNNARGYVGALFSIFVSYVVVIPVSLLPRRGRDLAQEFFFYWISKITLKIIGIRVIELNRPSDDLLRNQQAVFIANHRSTLDLMIFGALRIPKCRFFISGFDRSTLIVRPIAKSMKAIFTASQTNPSLRHQIFSQAANSLKADGRNVFLSPEGQRNPSGEISNFNKGAFHLAWDLNVPLVSLYIHTQDQVNPGLGFSTQPGMVYIFWGSAQFVQANDQAEQQTKAHPFQAAAEKYHSHYKEFRLRTIESQKEISTDSPFKKFEKNIEIVH